MKRLGWIFAGVVALVSATLAVAHAVYEPVFPEGSQAGPVTLSGLTKAEAAQALEAWWKEASAKEIELDTQFLTKDLGPSSIAELGLVLDVEATLDQASRLTLWQKAGNMVQAPEAQIAPMPAVFRLDEARTEELKRFVQRAAPEPQAASFALKEGKVQITPERAQVRLDEPALKRLLVRAIEDDAEAVLPVEEFGKDMPDEVLAQMSGIVANFKTEFPTYQTNRNQNIRRASELLNGTILQPQQEFSFNATVGERTRDRGFAVAGVYANGRHSVDVGGGICQVSSTLYNAALMGRMEITERFCHSLPVNYVPLGQDATVDWGTIDFRFKNPFDHPVAVVAEYASGSLEIALLGPPQPGYEVEIERQHGGSWSNGVKYRHDPSLAYGQTRVIDRGGAGRKITTWRVVKKDGEVVEREPLGESIYRGGPKIVAKNMNATAPAPAEEAAPEGPAETKPAAVAPTLVDAN